MAMRRVRMRGREGVGRVGGRGLSVERAAPAPGAEHHVPPPAAGAAAAPDGSLPARAPATSLTLRLQLESSAPCRRETSRGGNGVRTNTGGDALLPADWADAARWLGRCRRSARVTTKVLWYASRIACFGSLGTRAAG